MGDIRDGFNIPLSDWMPTMCIISIFPPSVVNTSIEFFSENAITTHTHTLTQRTYLSLTCGRASFRLAREKCVFFPLAFVWITMYITSNDECERRNFFLWELFYKCVPSKLALIWNRHSNELCMECIKVAFTEGNRGKSRFNHSAAHICILFVYPLSTGTGSVSLNTCEPNALSIKMKAFPCSLSLSLSSILSFHFSRCV